MGDFVVPVWHVAVGMAVDTDKIYERFRKLLANAPMPHAELAKALGVSASTVSRWAQGKTQPSPTQMKEAVSAIMQRLDQTRQMAEETGEILGEVERAVELHLKYRESQDRKTLKEWRSTTERLEELIST